MGHLPVVVAVRVLCVFAAVAAVPLVCLRGPLGPRDYLIAGVVATLAAMGAIFAAVAPRFVPVRRRKPDRET